MRAEAEGGPDRGRGRKPVPRLVLLAALALLGLVTALAPRPSPAQEAATLVADSLRIEADQRLIAEGKVEVFQNGARLTASRVIYDRAGDRLTIEGPLVLTNADGSSVVLADSAALDRGMNLGILRGARLVLDQQLQIAADEMVRASGRYTQLNRIVASSCQVCAANPVPLWEIRARRVIHDQQERQLYFDRAQFRVAGVPVMYIPRLRIPDPTLDRSSGFMMPRVRTTSKLGLGVKIPYFVALGPRRDLTVTPYIAPGRTSTVELRFRQAFANGAVQLDGAISRDDLLEGRLRSYLFGRGAFAVARGFTLSFGIETVSDDAYLLDYGYSTKDRLASEVALTRTRRNEYIAARVVSFSSIRDSENNATLPSLVGDLTFHRRFRPKIIGGEGGLRFQTHSHARDSAVDMIGRDVARASLRLDWRRNWMTSNGMVFSAMTDLNGDLYRVRQDSRYPGSIGRFTPTVAAELRWPWQKIDARGVAQVIEPVVQLVWSPEGQSPVPNEDSTLVELDEGNLFALSRYPGNDARESGLRLNMGVGWTRTAPGGWSLGVQAGRVLRGGEAGGFGAGTGLEGASSDWLAAVQLRDLGGLSLSNRALFDDALTVNRNDLRLSYTHARGTLAATYLYLQAAPAESRPADTHELTLDTRLDLTDAWSGAFETRYDLTQSRAASAGVGLRYANECLTVDLSLSRRFTSSTSVTPTTDFGLSVGLTGFGNSAAQRRARRSCMR